MSDLPTCPCCDGILDVPLRYKLSSACRCGFPDKVSWDDFPALRSGNLDLTTQQEDPFPNPMRSRAA